MSLLDLSLVTRCYTTLLSSRIPTFKDWPSTASLAVSAGAPESVSGQHALSFYLYHVHEDAHARNQDWGVNDSNPRRFKSMGLTLYYVMTPRSNLSDVHERALADQRVLGMALKTMRDQSVIDDTTTVDSTSGPMIVMPTRMRQLGNRLRATLQPVMANDASQYWQAGTHPVRLAAYYEVAATLLDPDDIQSRSSRVLMVGVQSFLGSGPRIERVFNSITFTVPGETQPRTVEADPAQVAYGAQLSIAGVNLKGDRTALLLLHADFSEPVEVDAAWNMTTNGNVLTVTVQPSANGVAVMPGIYGAVVQTTERKTLPDGSQRDFDHLSDQAAFAIAPAIVSVTGGPVHIATVDSFEPHLFGDTELLMFAGNRRLTRVAADPPGPGEFFTPNIPAAARTTIRFGYPASFGAGSIVPVRLIVRGAESIPRWEEVA